MTGIVTIRETEFPAVDHEKAIEATDSEVEDLVRTSNGPLSNKEKSVGTLRSLYTIPEELRHKLQSSRHNTHTHTFTKRKKKRAAYQHSYRSVRLFI